MLSAPIDSLIDNEIGIVPIYLRSEHNFTAYFLSRCSDQGVTKWGLGHSATRVELPERMIALVGKWTPEV